MEHLSIYLAEVYIAEGLSFTCNGWRKLFAIEESVYKELYVEFFAIVSYEENTKDPHYWQIINFRLGGQYRECSLIDLAWRLGIYEFEETRTLQFTMFYDSGFEIRNYEIWTTIANGLYDLKSSQEILIQSHIHRFLNCLITFIVNH